jgi:cold shock protein
MTETTRTGKVKFFNHRKGFGFIVPDDGTRDVHIAGYRVPKGLKLEQDQRVEYMLAEGKRGPYAENLRVLG